VIKSVGLDFKSATLYILYMYEYLQDKRPEVSVRFISNGMIYPLCYYFIAYQMLLAIASIR